MQNAKNPKKIQKKIQKIKCGEAVTGHLTVALIISPAFECLQEWLMTS